MGAYGSPDLSGKSNNIQCKKCNKVIESDLYNYCPYCGTKKGKKRNAHWLVWVIVTLMIILIINNPNANNKEYPINSIPLNREEFLSTCEEYNYEELARNPDKNNGKNAKFIGKVIQVQENIASVMLRISTSKENHYDDVIYCTYKYNEDESKILEDDMVTVYGILRGTQTYTAVLGNTITIPYLEVKFIELNND